MKTLLSCLLLLAASTTYSQIKNINGHQVDTAAMTRFLQVKMDSFQLPGLSIAIINDGKIVYHRELGYADIAAKKPVDVNTLFEAASMSKPVFAYFVIKMAEKGVLSLDTPLYKYLPFPDLAYDKRYSWHWILLFRRSLSVPRDGDGPSAAYGSTPFG